MYTFFCGSLARIPIVCSCVVFNYSSQIHPDEERSVALKRRESDEIGESLSQSDSFHSFLPIVSD
jgi:hypothetical protein